MTSTPWPSPMVPEKRARTKRPRVWPWQVALRRPNLAISDGALWVWKRANRWNVHVEEQRGWQR